MRLYPRVIDAAEFLCPLSCGFHGTDQCVPDTTGFKLGQTGDGRSAGRCHLVTQRCRMFARLKDHASGASHSLGGQL